MSRVEMGCCTAFGICSLVSGDKWRIDDEAGVARSISTRGRLRKFSRSSSIGSGRDAVSDFFAPGMDMKRACEVVPRFDTVSTLRENFADTKGFFFDRQ